MKNDNTSPATNILVNHVGLTSEHEAPFKRRMIRPRIMYIEAAKKAGANRSIRLCAIYGLVVQFGLSSALTNLATYPHASTKVHINQHVLEKE
jgi:hypothetical protein